MKMIHVLAAAPLLVAFAGGAGAAAFATPAVPAVPAAPAVPAVPATPATPAVPAAPAVPATPAATPTQAAQVRTMAARLTAPAVVRPVVTWQVSAPVAGQVTDVTVLPGQTVSRGQMLARLAGPEIDAEAARRAAALRMASVTRDAAAQHLAIAQRQFAARLNTSEDVIRAKTALANARQQVKIARAAATSLPALSAITARTPGTVTSVVAVNGQFVGAGQVLMTVVPDNALRVAARFFGEPARQVAVGMTGRFLASGEPEATAVTVAQSVWSATVPGQREVWLTPAKGATISAGQSGTVTLALPASKLVAVPSEALVLDQGQWWVVVRDKGGNHRRGVVPGRSADGWTSVYGLDVGAQVVVTDPYLVFHEDFAKHYQQAD